jgi:tetratricopeptide (TPR) repeat protein
MLMRTLRNLILVASIGLLPTACVYYNTFFNAEQAYVEAERKRIKAEASTTTSQATGTSGASQSRVSSRRQSSSSSSNRSRSRSSSSRRPSGSKDELYRIAIEKSAKVIAYYPESDYIDDALLLMAKSYYRLGEFARGLRKCDELLGSYPDGEFVTEAAYWRGLSLWRLGRDDEARGVLEEIVADVSSVNRGDAAFALAELVAEQGDLERSWTLYRVAVDYARDEEFRSNASLALGEALILAGRPGAAADVYLYLANSARFNSDRFLALVEAANALRLVDDYEGALAILEPLLDDQRHVETVPRTRVEIARTYAERNDIETAIFLYQELIDDEVTEASQRRSSSSQGERQINFSAEAYEAHYLLGSIQEQKYRNLELAGELFGTASRGREWVGDSAKVRKSGIDTWAELHATMSDTSDSTLDAKIPGVLYQIGELFYFQLGVPDSARHYFSRLIDEYPANPQTPRAQFSVGWLLMNVEGDSSAAYEAWEPLLQDTTRSVLVGELQTVVRQVMGVDMTAPRDPAEDAYARALSEWLTALDSLPAHPPVTADSAQMETWWHSWSTRHSHLAPDYLRMFTQIAEQYPESPYASKSHFVMAWVAENVSLDTSRANDLYHSVALNTEFAPGIAMRADSILAMRRPQAPTPSPQAEASTDSTAQTELDTEPMGNGIPSDSTQTVVDIEPPASDPPDSQGETGIPFGPGSLDEEPRSIPPRPGSGR